MGRCFLILHGLTGSSHEHWQCWLTEQLRAAGEDVRFPVLPSPCTPRAADWAGVMHSELAAMPGERTVLCHSLSCILWAHEAGEVARERPVDRALLVAPPCPSTPLPGTDGFFPAPLDPAAVSASAASIRVVAGTDDPYCPDGALRSFAGPLGLECDVLDGQAHLNVDAGYGPWPAMLEWCTSGLTGPLLPRNG